MTQEQAAPQDPVERAGRILWLMERAQRLMANAALRGDADNGFQIPDPRIVGAAFADFAGKAAANPGRFVTAQLELWRDHFDLWSRFARRAEGEAIEPMAVPARDDRRFADAAWSEHPMFDYVKQAYLLNARWLQSTVQQVDEIDDDTRRKVEFYMRQFVDACAPSNFVATNPKVLRETFDSSGENLVRGLEHLVADLERGNGRLDIAMTDATAFRLGDNIAATPGKVIVQNDLMQLIQYAPSTDAVHRRPLLIVPPWINKFYILDLKPQNSFIKWAVDQGHTLFVISWVNPDERLARKAFDDYMLEGPLAALDAIEQATGEREANVIGYCIGGTLLACTLAWMARRNDRRFASATFFTALTDFAEAGEIKVFIDDAQVSLLEAHVAKKGYLEGRHMATVFNLLRDNDLIWSFVVNNYLLGREPLPFDLLYWNADATRMPAAMHSYYLRHMYLENRLVQPGGLTLAGEPLDLRTIDLPIYQLSAESDHIAPWKSTYALSRLVRGPYRFVLSGSGHIAGVINPPVANKYYYLTNAKNPASPDGWIAGATRHAGSWWTDWAAWVARHGGGQVPARTPGGGALAPIEDAPGSYVAVRAQD
ncbi:MAG TPA: class I poly(R)-hydroxyalkanoic acid synthase [Methylomirabilota bacterium]|nr:class I poly(R)-hydroxyalkanoic acid synthase [Methylomirabilota bacterium]